MIDEALLLTFERSHKVVLGSLLKGVATCAVHTFACQRNERSAIRQELRPQPAVAGKRIVPVLVDNCIERGLPAGHDLFEDD